MCLCVCEWLRGCVYVVGFQGEEQKPGGIMIFLDARPENSKEEERKLLRLCELQACLTLDVAGTDVAWIPKYVAVERYDINIWGTEFLIIRVTALPRSPD